MANGVEAAVSVGLLVVSVALVASVGGCFILQLMVIPGLLLMLLMLW